MSSLANKQILLGVTGGIAAYKSAELIRRLSERGAQVRVCMTSAAREFITPLTLQALSGHPVHTDLLDPAAEAAMGHIELARWADLVLIAPASANFMARLAQGKGDDLLTTLCLATAAPVALAPAMNQGMWHNAATQDNLTRLRQRGVHCFGPAEGSQACGETGPGRMLEPEQLADAAQSLFHTGALAGKQVVITAGPTREALDPVRYISNHSSGKMGYALARAASDAGAKVTLISGPVALAAPERITTLPVTSALEMYQTAVEQAQNCDLFIGVAAVADYRPAQVATDKIKKDEEQLTLTLVRNPDIIAAVAALEKRPYTVGFAAESQQLLAHAREKLQRKKLDLIIANDISSAGTGFNSDDNQVTVLDARGESSLPRARKEQLARDLIKLIAQRLQEMGS